MPVPPAALELLTALSKDISDASGLWRLHGRTLDANRIRETLRLLEDALGQSDLVPSFDRFATPLC